MLYWQIFHQLVNAELIGEQCRAYRVEVERIKVGEIDPLSQSFQTSISDLGS